MCAIAGIFSKNERVGKSELEQMCERMKLRGPDGEGIYVGKQVGLGHRRLSIIDLSTGGQPMFSADRSVVIVFNGEIYNFPELRETLEENGQVFITQSDTEVVLNGYKAYGLEGIVRRLEGMFAFALYDTVSGDLYLARDKFGEKPLFVREEGGNISFASELKAFAPDLECFHLDIEALNYFLMLSYIPAPYTIYREIRKLKPGVYWKITPDGIREEHRYYNLAEMFSEKGKQLSFEETKRELREHLMESVRRRMVADVPMGAFLSGGIDSSIVCCIMSRLSEKPINTFSIGFKEREYDESNRARIVANAIGSNHTEYILDYKDVLEILDDIISYYDEPFGDSSAIPSYYVAKLAKEKVKVVLTGDCADELFGGYEKYLGKYYVDKYRKIPVFARRLFEEMLKLLPLNSYTENIHRKFQKVVSYAGVDDFDLHYNFMCLGFADKQRKRVLVDDYYMDIKGDIKESFERLQDQSYLQKEQYLDILTVLEGDMFPKVDRACMHNSLENRSPFIDSKIVDFALNLPDSFKIRGKNKKYILKEAFKELLPEETLKFSKSGFGVPVDYWFRKELKDELKMILAEDFVREQGIFNYDYVALLLDEHQKRKKNHKSQLWNLYVFQKWYRMKYVISQ